MKCRSNKFKYKIPEFSAIQSVLLFPEKLHTYRLQQVDMNQFEKCKPCSGSPTLFAVFDNQINFWRCPDKPYKIIIKYFPPLMEF